MGTNTDNGYFYLPAEGESASTGLLLYNNALCATDTVIASLVTNSHSSITSADQLTIGTPSDTLWTDGVLVWSNSTTIADALDEINETLSSLAPADALSFDSVALTGSGTTFYTGRLSAGNAQYGSSGSGFTAGASVTGRIISDGGFGLKFSDTTTMWNKADEGSIMLYLNSTAISSADLASNFTEGERTATQSYTPVTSGSLTISTVGVYNSFAKWQKGTLSATITSTQLTQGYNAIYVKHDLSTDQNSTVYEIFYDNDTGAVPSVGSPTITENTPVFKWLSGVKYYDRGSTFNLSIDSAQNCFNNVYHSSKIIVYYSSCGCISTGNIDWDDATVSGVSSPPAINDTMLVTNKVTTVPNSQVRSSNGRTYVYPVSPYGSHGSMVTGSNNTMIDAYTATSTDLLDSFNDEEYRLNDDDSASNSYPNNYDIVPTITSEWTSTSVVSDGQAQVRMGSLRVPTIDFTSGYLPSGQTANYSAYTASGTYYRAFRDSGTPHQGGTLVITNIGSADITTVGSGNVNVEIKLPTQTGWLDLGTPYNAGTFTGADGDGCRTGQTGTSWTWSSGVFTTADSGWMAVIKITIRTASETITQIQESGW